MSVTDKKTSQVTWDFRTIVDTDELLRDPKVRATIEKLRTVGVPKRQAPKPTSNDK